MRQDEPVEFDVRYLFSFLFLDLVARLRRVFLRFAFFVKASLRNQSRQ